MENEDIETQKPKMKLVRCKRPDMLEKIRQHQGLRTYTETVNFLMRYYLNHKKVFIE